MSSATEPRVDCLDDFDLVPLSLLVPPPAGTCHFSKLSTELILSIAEYLDVATCLTLSQTCRAINNISRERVTYWYSSQFAHGLLPRVTDQSSLTAQELRSTAIKSTNIAWIWENSSPRVRRRVTLQWVCEKEQYFLPLGSRWLFRYGVSQGDTTDSTIYIYDLIGGRNVEPPIHLLPSQRLDKIVGESLAPNKVMFAILFEPSPSTLIKVMAAEFEASNRGSKVSISEAYQFSIDRSAVDVVFQEGILAVVTDQTVILQKWDSPTTKRETAPNQVWRTRGCRIARSCLIVCEFSSQSGEDWRIVSYDISSFRDGVDYSGKEEHERLLWPVSVATLDGLPLLPFLAPYQDDRLSQELQFRMLIYAYEYSNQISYLCKCDFKLPVASHHEQSSATSGLIVETPDILGLDENKDPRNCPRTSEGCLIGDSSARIVWTTSNGQLRIYSAWTEEYPWRSRPIDSSRPMSVPRLLIFDEQLGVLILSERTDQVTLLWFTDYN